jgi:hypothetical protein
MINLSNTPNQTFDPLKVDDFVAELNADPEDDWNYKVKHDPKGTGNSLIEIYDENGEFVSYL